MAERMRSITVRLSPSHIRALESRAKARGLGTAPYLRSLVVDQLEREEQGGAVADFDALAQRIDGLKHALARATSAILIDLQTTTKVDKKKILTGEQIRQWVGHNVIGSGGNFHAFDPGDGGRAG